jgi:A118 family predicted phage portal protein
MNIFEALRQRGFPSVDAEPYGRIAVWRSWYEGYVDSFHRYKIYNGDNHIKMRRYTVGMGKKVCEDWASLLLNEKVAICLEGETEQAFVDDILTANNFRVKVSELEELTMALGTGAIVARVEGAALSDSGQVIGGRILLDYCTAEQIVPLTWINGVVQDCAFVTGKTVGEKKYTYVQIHHLTDAGTYDVDNVLYKDSTGSLEEVPLTSVDGFETIPPVIHTGSTRPLFVINRPNIANNAEIGSPMGVSIFANAIDQLKGVDIAYDSYVNEFVLGRKRIFLRPEFLKTVDGERTFDPTDATYYLLPGENTDGIKEIDMTLRTDEHNAGLQDMLNMLSAKCGFGESYYKFDRGNIATATQVVSENSSLFRNVQKHEIILRQMLEDLSRLLLWLGNTFQGQSLNENVEISVDFDDSIIEDQATDRAQDRLDVAMGVMSLAEYRAKWYNEAPETAAAALPTAVELVSAE